MKLGKFGIGIYGCKFEGNVGSLHRSCYLYGASFMFMIKARYKKEITDTPCSTRHIPLFLWDKLEIPYSFEPVIIELVEGATSLWDFKHPKNAIYVLGAEDSGVCKEYMKDGYKKIYIPSLEPKSMNVSVCGSVVMAHRFNQLSKT